MESEIQEIMRENAELKARDRALTARIAELDKPRTLSLKVYELGKTYTSTKGEKHVGKGNIGVHGLNARFPTTLYPDQWKALAAFMPQVLAAIEKNKVKLSFKSVTDLVQ
jgi:hypothetical protein